MTQDNDIHKLAVEVKGMFQEAWDRNKTVLPLNCALKSNLKKTPASKSKSAALRAEGSSTASKAASKPAPPAPLPPPAKAAKDGALLLLLLHAVSCPPPCLTQHISAHISARKAGSDAKESDAKERKRKRPMSAPLALDCDLVIRGVPRA